MSFKKYNLAVLITLWSTAIICLNLHYVSRWNLHTESLVELTKGVNTTAVPKPSKPLKHYDVLINGYMRSGSTLTGMILGWRKDAFYFYEPLWKISRWTYWHSNDTVCRSDRLECRTVEPENAIKDTSFPGNVKSLTGGSLVMAKNVLSKLYKCQFSDFKRTVFHPGITDTFGGPSWDQMAACIKRKRNETFCLHMYPVNKCKNATHRVSKVLRLTTDLLNDILRERENLKIVHLFRDPRAIINSKNQSWYHVPTSEKLTEEAKSLCNRMTHDLREGKKLLKLYPGRFRFVYYEDMNENPFEKVKLLFKYLGMDLNENKYPKLRQLPVFSKFKKRTSREKNTAFWWRQSLTWDFVQKMEHICSDVNKELGYKSISNEEEYKNLSFKSVDIPKEYLLT